MTRQLRYEGPRIEDLLDRIRTDHGPDARILSADRVRSGGFGGFFPKESFEVIVECDEPGAPPLGAPPLDLPPSDVDGFAAVLASMVQDTVEEPGETTTPPPAPTFRAPDGPAPSLPAPSLPAPDVPFVPESATAAPPDFLASAPVPVVETNPPDPVDLTSFGDPSCPADASSLGDSRHFDVTHLDISQLDDPGHDGPVELDEAFELLAHRLDADIPTLPIDGIVMVVGERDEAVRVACQLAGSVGQFQRDVLVAGPGRERPLPAPVVARVIAESARRADKRSRVPGPRFVVLELQPGLAGHRWATEVISTVAPTQVRMAVAGWRLADQESRTLTALRRVDAIDLIGMDQAVAPEQFLDLHAPVATLDGEPATAELWTALLVSVGRVDALASYEPTPLDPASVGTVPGPVSLRR